MIPLDTPADVAQVLSEQAAIVREKIAGLTEALSKIEALKAEVLDMRSVDFKKYADIIVNLEMKNSFYWLIKHFDGEMLITSAAGSTKKAALRLCGDSSACKMRRSSCRRMAYRQEANGDSSLQKSIGP